MQTYIFTAKNRETGESVNSEVQAENEQAAAEMLNSRNLFPISIAVKSRQSKRFKLPFGKHVSNKEKVLFTRQLSTLINAGLPILQSLRSAQEQVTSAHMKSYIAQIVTDVEGGSALSAALAKYPEVFNQTYVNVVAAGETSGSLDKTLEKLAQQLEKDALIYSKVRGAMVYPIIVLSVVIVVLIFMLLVVLPQVGTVYKDFNKELPFVTKLLLTASGIVGRLWWLFLILAGGGIYALRNYIKTAAGRRWFDQVKLKIPLISRLLRKVYMARFARTMATLLSSGVPILNALSITKGAVNNQIIAEQLDITSGEVRGGKALSASIKERPDFLSLVPQMIKIGEDSGAIDATLEKLAVYFENEIDETVKSLSTAIEPALMVVLGIVVGGILIAVLLPIYGLVGQGI